VRGRVTRYVEYARALLAMRLKGRVTLWISATCFALTAPCEGADPPPQPSAAAKESDAKAAAAPQDKAAGSAKPAPSPTDEAAIASATDVPTPTGGSDPRVGSTSDQPKSLSVEKRSDNAEDSEAEDDGAESSPERKLIEELLDKAESLRFDANGDEAEDLQPVLDLYRRAVEAGSPEACNLLGEVYMYGQADQPLDFDLARYYFHRGADMGLAESQHNLAVLYALGLGHAKGREPEHMTLMRQRYRAEDIAKVTASSATAAQDVASNGVADGAAPTDSISVVPAVKPAATSVKSTAAGSSLTVAQVQAEYDTLDAEVAVDRQLYELERNLTKDKNLPGIRDDRKVWLKTAYCALVRVANWAMVVLEGRDVRLLRSRGRVPSGEIICRVPSPLRLRCA